MGKRLLVLAVLVAVVPAVALAAQRSSGNFMVTLKPGAEKPAGPAGGSGTATIKLAGGKACWTITTKGIGTPTAAHIHKGGAGVSGPVVVPFGAAFKPKGCQAASPAVLKAIMAKPAAYYVNVHTAKYPGGAIRAQLAGKTASGGGTGSGSGYGSK